jgi:hypothetical protein
VADTEHPRDADTSLAPFLEAIDPASAEQRLAELVSRHADPLIGSIIRRKLNVSLVHSDGGSRNQDALELASEIRARLIEELHSLRASESGRAIASFGAYVAVMTYNGCHDYLRRLYPRRWQLRNKLRYLFTHRHQLALWRGEEREWLCGFAAWRGRTTPHDTGRWEAVRRDPGAVLDDAIVGATPSAASLGALVEALLRRAGAPVDLDGLVEVVAEVWQVEDAPATSEADGDARLVDPAPDAGTRLSDRRYLERLWIEICALPLRQREALLLNLRDAQGRGTVALFPIVGVASIRQIASALERPAEQLAAEWKTLPWDDVTIGRRLGIERQQVVNLRKAARARLSRRMRGW